MTLSQLEGIKTKHGGYASFAVWADDIKDINVIQKNVGILHANMVIVGLNASGDCPPLGNFHASGQGKRDVWLRQVFNKPPVYGSYMTDVFKHTKAVNQNEVVVSSAQEAAARSKFQEELNDIGASSPRIIAVGKEAAKYLQKWGYDVTLIPHYAGKGLTKSDWLAAVAVQLNKL